MIVASLREASVKFILLELKKENLGYLEGSFLDPMIIAKDEYHEYHVHVYTQYIELSVYILIHWTN